MKTMRDWCLSAAAIGILTAACAGQRPAPTISRESVAPASAVTRRGAPVRLLGTPVAVGAPLPSATLVDATTQQTVDLARERGKVLFLSVVVSLETAV